MALTDRFLLFRTDDIQETFVKEYDEAVVYDSRDEPSVLHEGPVRLLANGWVELPTGRLLSPQSVHHIDQVSDGGA